MLERAPRPCAFLGGSKAGVQEESQGEAGAGSPQHGKEGLMRGAVSTVVGSSGQPV